jgi:hypothetical protein
MQILFVNVADKADSENLRKVLADRIQQIRRVTEDRIDELVAATEELVANSKNEVSQALFEVAMEPVRAWIATNGQLPGEPPNVHSYLLGEMGRLRYVSSLRASVNRFGGWDRFDYWQGLGTGARASVVKRCESPAKEIKDLVNAALTNEKLKPVHNLIKHFASELETAITAYHRWAEGLGGTAFKSQLVDDTAYWAECKARWGLGKGYRGDIQAKTATWFDEASHQERRAFIEAEIQKQWSVVLAKLNQSLSSPGGPAPVAPAEAARGA